MIESLPLWFVIIGYSLVGLVIGSFISLVSWRLPRNIDGDTQVLFKTLAWDRSRCCHCQQPLSAWQLIPLVSWLWQKGQTQCCQQPISWRYPIIETITLSLTILTLFLHPDHQQLLAGQVSYSGWASLLFVWTLIAISIIDFEHLLIPDRLSLPLLWLGLIVNSNDWGSVSLNDALWGAITGYTSLWLLFQIHRVFTGKEGMGYGDFKLSAALGAWLGWSALIPIFIIAGITAILVISFLAITGRQSINQAFSFGPWLAFSGIVVLLGGF